EGGSAAQRIGRHEYTVGTGTGYGNQDIMSGSSSAGQMQENRSGAAPDRRTPIRAAHFGKRTNQTFENGSVKPTRTLHALLLCGRTEGHIPGTGENESRTLIRGLDCLRLYSIGASKTTTNSSNTAGGAGVPVCYFAS